MWNAWERTQRKLRTVCVRTIKHKFGSTKFGSVPGGEAADGSVGGTVDVTVGEAAEVTAGESVV